MSRLKPTIQILLENLEGLFDDLDLFAIIYLMGDEQIVQDALAYLMSSRFTFTNLLLR